MVNGRNSGPWGSGPSNQQPPNRPQPDIDEIIRKGQDKIKNLFPSDGGGSAKGYAIIAAICALLWLATGVYRVEPDEQGVVMRFGEFHRTTQPGLRYHLPAPFESVFKPKVTRVNRLEVGFRSPGQSGFLGMNNGQKAASLLEESLMLTGDENIVDINFEVQWKVNDAKNYLFNIRSPEETVKQAAESAMREVIGRTQIATALAEGRVQVEAEAMKLLQEILDSYSAGIQIVRMQMLKVDPPAEVIDAFRDVQTARADKERLRNEAEAYRNDIIPRARGQAERMIQEAEAYKQEVVERSKGESSRFLAVYNEYKEAPDVTRKRIYLETMEGIMQGMSKMIITDSKSGSVLPYLPLNELKPKSRDEGAKQ